MTPLIDIIFQLVIFLLVTTSFVHDTGLDITTPSAAMAGYMDPVSLRVTIAASGTVYTEGQQITLPQLQERVRRYVENQPDGSVIIISDHRVSAGQLVGVIDVAKQAGAKDIALAAQPMEEK